MHETCSILVLPDNRELIVPEHAYLHEALDRHGISLTAYCDGMGLCGKCIVEIKLADGNRPPATEADSKFLSEEELEKGFRLACKWRVICNAEITIPDKSRVNHLNILTKDAGETPLKLSADFSPDKPYGFAFDIGTTTVVGSIVDYRTGQTLAVSSYLNGQQKYGADVISRINHSLSEKGIEELNSELIKTINKIIADVLGESKVPSDKVAEIVSSLIHKNFPAHSKPSIKADIQKKWKACRKYYYPVFIVEFEYQNEIQFILNLIFNDSNSIIIIIISEYS